MAGHAAAAAASLMLRESLLKDAAQSAKTELEQAVAAHVAVAAASRLVVNNDERARSSAAWGSIETRMSNLGWPQSIIRRLSGF